MQECYRVLVGSGFLKPAEFWALDPAEVWWLLEARRPPQYGWLSADDMAELWEEGVNEGIFDG